MSAIDESIAHWERMRDGTGADGEEPTGPNCALCKKHLWCNGCPVALFTRSTSCSRSPYTAARDAWQNHGLDSPEFHAAAQDEVDFLKIVKSSQVTK